MRKKLFFGLALVILGFACGYAQNKPTEDSAANKLAHLKQQRIELLKDRVAKIASLAEVDLVDKSAVIEPIPVELHASSPVNLRVSHYENESLKLDLHGQGKAHLKMFVDGITVSVGGCVCVGKGEGGWLILRF